MLKFRLNKFYRIVYGLIFISLIVQELIESLNWGIENALDIDVMALSTISVITIFQNNNFNKFIVTLVLGYFIWMLIYRHFPAYPEYQSFTFIFYSLGLKSMEIQMFIHIILYAGLVIASYSFKLKESNN